MCRRDANLFGFANLFESFITLARSLEDTLEARCQRRVPCSVLRCLIRPPLAIVMQRRDLGAFTWRAWCHTGPLHAMGESAKAMN